MNYQIISIVAYFICQLENSCSDDKTIKMYSITKDSFRKCIDIKLSKWVETKYKIDHINHLNIL